MKNENKKKAGNVPQTLPAQQHSVLTRLKGSLPFVNSIAIELHCVVERLNVFLRHVKSLFSSVRYINNAESRAKTYSQN